MEAIKRKIRAGIKRVIPGHLPDFMIIGAQKSATTSLHYYLSQHPRLSGSRPKEVHYFDREENYAKGLSWYKHNFPNMKSLSGDLLYFESSPSYLYDAVVPGRIHQLNPSMRFIVLLRDPVQRAFSAWNMYRGFLRKGQVKKFLLDPFPPGAPNPVYDFFYKDGKEFPSFRQTIDWELGLVNQEPTEPSIFRRGLYADQLQRYLTYFGKEQFHVVGFKELVGNLARSLSALYQYLGVPEYPFSRLTIESYNKGAYEDRMSPADAQFAASLYEPANQALEKLLGRRINW